MRELLDLETSLLDEDGSCRDMNFESATWAGVTALMARLESSFRPVAGNDHVSMPALNSPILPV